MDPLAKRMKQEAARLKQEWFTRECARRGLPEPTFEYRFHPVRRWRLDVAFVDHRIGIEIQGGIFIQGRHTRGAALLGEHDKLNALAAARWAVFFRTPRSFITEETFTLLTECFGRTA